MEDPHPGKRRNRIHKTTGTLRRLVSEIAGMANTTTPSFAASRFASPYQEWAAAKVFGSSLQSFKLSVNIY
jgi:hypothetical protein